MSINTINYYCSGCGLCVKGKTNALDYNEHGFITPRQGLMDTELCNQVCPCFDDLTQTYANNDVFGNYVSVWEGYSGNETIRHRASSGGCVTSIASYLLQSGYIDGVIHSVMDPDKPWRTVTVCSETEQELIERCGSRYAQSSPLYDFESLMEDGKKYAYIGKPCDVYSLQQYRKISDKTREKIVLTISFFCAGQPGENANQKLLVKLLGDEAGKCSHLDYRGNGWPGMASAISSSGASGKMKYEESWGKILGRDIRPLCRYCMIGMGEPADISCGDSWNLTEDLKPSFEEAEGRNLIFARTESGSRIVREAINAHFICADSFESKIERIKHIQPSQYDRKITMGAKVAAMKLMFRPYPAYNAQQLKYFSKFSDRSRLWEVFRGTVGRIVRRRI